MKRSTQIRAALRIAHDKQDFHIDEVKKACRIRHGRFEDSAANSIMREVKDIAPFDIWPVYERPGWWTRSATAEIRILALYRAAERNATEQQRNADTLRRHRRGDPLTGQARLAAKQAVGVKELFEDDLPAPDRQDSCLARIDRLRAP